MNHLSRIHGPPVGNHWSRRSRCDQLTTDLRIGYSVIIWDHTRYSFTIFGWTDIFPTTLGDGSISRFRNRLFLAPTDAGRGFFGECTGSGRGMTSCRYLVRWNGNNNNFLRTESSGYCFRVGRWDLFGPTYQNSAHKVTARGRLQNRVQWPVTMAVEGDGRPHAGDNTMVYVCISWAVMVTQTSISTRGPNAIFRPNLVSHFARSVWNEFSLPRPQWSVKTARQTQCQKKFCSERSFEISKFFFGVVHFVLSCSTRYAGTYVRNNNHSSIPTWVYPQRKL